MLQIQDYLFAFVKIYEIMIFIRIIGSWFPQFQNNSIYHFVWGSTEPLLGLFRRIMPPIGVIDISPLAALILLYLLGEMFS